MSQNGKIPADRPGKPTEKSLSRLPRLQWWAYSLPLFLKMLGIVVLVSGIFAGVVYYQVRANIRSAHDKIHVLAASRAAASLVSQLEHHEVAADASRVEESITDLVRVFPDISYVLVLDKQERLLAHHFAFPMEVPADLPRQADRLCTSCHTKPEVLDNDSASLVETASGLQLDSSNVRKFLRPMGSIIEASAPLLGGDAGSVRVGYGDMSIKSEMETISEALIRSLIICVVLGHVLALGMTYLLVHPVLNLVQTTKAIGAGNFTSRARVYSADEIGRLARAINLMADKLQAYRVEVEGKEALRASVLDRVVQAQEDERIRIARELHDQLGQDLYRMLLLVQDIRRDSGPDPRQQELEESIRLLIDEVRRLAWGIRPAVLDDFGLDSALEQYTKEISNLSGMQIDYQCGFPAGAERLPRRVEVILYRVTQEAVTNVIRHSSAKRASVVLLRRDSEVTLLVEDDGKGFDTRTVLRQAVCCLGLTGMKERVSLAGGVMTIDSEPGKGAAIRAQIPINERSPCQSALS